MDDQKILRPRRGTKTKMKSTRKSSIVLEEGEIFIECPDSGIGKGKCKVKIGDGVSAYAMLPYALGNVVEDEPVDFLEDRRTDIQELIDEVVAGELLVKIIANMKRIAQLLFFKFDDYFTRTEINETVATINAALDDRYTKEEVNTIVARIDGDIITVDNKFANYYTKTQIDTTVTSINTSITNTNARFDSYYTKAQIDNIISNYYTKQQTKDLVLIDVVNSDPSNPDVGQQWILKN